MGEKKLLNIDLDYTIKVRLPIIIFTVLITYGCAFWLGTPTRKGYGYEPKQPIAFSHKLHAGEMKLDCRYCHVGVDKSRHATVPSVDTCMNCHATVKAVGRNPDKDHYNYESHVAHKDGTLGEAVQSILDVKKKFKDENDYFKNINSLENAKEIAEILDSIINKDENQTAFFNTYKNAVEWQDKDLIQLIELEKKNNVSNQSVIAVNKSLAAVNKGIEDNNKKIELENKTLPKDKQKKLNPLVPLFKMTRHPGDDRKKMIRLMMDELYRINSYNSSEIKKLTSYFKSDKALKWKRIYRLPKYVYFNHSVHVNKGIDCSNCHGNVANLDSMKKMKPITMGRCLDCHRGDYKEYHEGLEEKVVGPESCGVCHR